MLSHRIVMLQWKIFKRGKRVLKPSGFFTWADLDDAKISDLTPQFLKLKE